MSEALPIGPVRPTAVAADGAVRSAIARAADRTGTDFRYLLAQAQLESSLDPTSRASTSSAAGLYQFTEGTWLETLDRHGARHGLGWAADRITQGRLEEAGDTDRIMALRYDADASALMAAELALDNGAELKTHLGREPDAAELYLGHFLGIGGARQFLDALRDTPDRLAAEVLPKAAAANRGVFYDSGGGARSVSDVMDLIRGRMVTAMDVSGVVEPPMFEAQPVAWNGHPGIAAASPQLGMNAGASVPQRSMADTLRNTFAVADSGSHGAPALVRNAYDKLKRFGL